MAENTVRGSHTNKRKDDNLDAEANGEVIQGQKAEIKERKTQKVVKSTAIGVGEDNQVEEADQICPQPDGILKMKKLKKLVLQAIQESGCAEDETQLGNELQEKVKSSSKFSEDKNLCVWWPKIESKTFLS